jgi:kynurenine 3-monooxygenase
MSQPKVVIVGAGLGGTLLALFLARRGFAVELYERRGDLRKEPVEPGRSIKLTLAERGLAALAELGLAERVKREICVPLTHRAVHDGRGTITLQPYGKDDSEAIHSFSRNDLNGLLLDEAERYPNLSLRFRHRCVGLDKETATAYFEDRPEARGDVLIGADGAFSVVRRHMQRRERADFRQDFLAWGYKEITINPATPGQPPLDPHALHVWPAGDHMLFALPNFDGSLCGVCTLPFEGDHSFAAIETEEGMTALFRAHFADVLPYLPDLFHELRTRPISEFVTVRTNRWHHRGKVLLIGDAAHSVVPFYGQGMNAAFEDASTLNRLLDRRGTENWEAVFAELQALRKPSTDILARLSIDNFHELRDTVRRPIVTARKRTSVFLNRLLGQHSVPLYTMISHTTMPYAEAVQRHQRQERIARLLGLDLVVGTVALHVRVKTALSRRRAARKAAKEALAAEGLPAATTPRG